MRNSTARRLLGVLVLVAALAGCGDTLPRGNDPVRALDTGISHIHALGINPADGKLYAGSHTGLFVVTGNGEPRRVGDNARDLMGFTIIGPDHFLGSGHPGADATREPPHLGLIESTDGGETWERVSLLGEADFHAMEVKHGMVYGYDSQSRSVMVSGDMESWHSRATLPMADFAVSPDDAGALLSTTRKGVLRSTNGGRNFEGSGTGPTLLYLDWPKSNRLVGVDPAGKVYTSADGGTSWRQTGKVPGPLSAVTWHVRTGIYVATDRAIYRSTDRGKTFDVFQRLGSH